MYSTTRASFRIIVLTPLPSSMYLFKKMMWKQVFRPGSLCRSRSSDSVCWRSCSTFDVARYATNPLTTGRKQCCYYINLSLLSFFARSGMMQTAGGVAMGSVIGSGVSNMLFGGRSHGEEAAPQQQQQQQSSSFDNSGGNSCEILAKDFTQCLYATSNDMSACNFYLVRSSPLCPVSIVIH